MTTDKKYNFNVRTLLYTTTIVALFAWLAAYTNVWIGLAFGLPFGLMIIAQARSKGYLEWEEDATPSRLLRILAFFVGFFDGVFIGMICCGMLENLLKSISEEFANWLAGIFPFWQTVLGCGFILGTTAFVIPRFFARSPIILKIFGA